MRDIQNLRGDFNLHNLLIVCKAYFMDILFLQRLL